MVDSFGASLNVIDNQFFSLQVFFSVVFCPDGGIVWCFLHSPTVFFIRCFSSVFTLP